MSMTIGYGPFGPDPRGRFNFEPGAPEAVLYFEDSPRRVRVLFSGETVAQSARMKLLHETGHMPVYYFPVDDVQSELLEPTDHRTRCPHKGEATYASVRVGNRVAGNAMWRYDDPIEGAPPLAEYAAFEWGRMDAWYEEDEEIFVHPRDPYHRFDVLASSRHVRVLAGDTLIAETRRPALLFETSLPVRCYIPREDIRMELLEPSPQRTRCPYKGQTTGYWHVRAGDTEVDDAAWAYDEPLPVAGPVAGRIAFYSEKVRIEVDGRAI
jgi:uncharacterized protein (DUF427 family)